MKVFLVLDLFVNNIKVGMFDQEYDDVNGKQEFNIIYEYLVFIIRVVKDFNLVSVY